MTYTVLLIDYDPKSIERIRRVLASIPVRVVEARCGRSGLEEHRRARPDLTLVQDLIPNLHGFDVCKEIKRSDGGSTHPVVLLCAPSSHHVLLDTGCDAYIKKPFGDAELLRVLERLLPPVSGLDQPTCGEATALGAPDPATLDSLELEVSERIDTALVFNA
jgi:DNA-binding response OmpR family regulator